MGNLLRLRQEFPSVERFTYLYAGKLGPMHRQAPKTLATYTSHWEMQGGFGWVERWKEDAAPLTEALATLLGAQVDGITILTSTESAARCAHLAPEATIAYEASAEDELSTAPDWIPAILTRQRLPIYEHEVAAVISLLEAQRPQLLVLSHVAPLSGRLRSDEELRAITVSAQTTNTKVILDVERTIGIVPLRLSALPLYAAVGSCSRWLCGGPGSAFLWLNPERNPQPIRAEAPPPTSYLVAETTARLLAQLGVEKIREKSMRQTQRLLDGALSRGFSVNTPRQAEQRGGTVAIKVPHTYAVFRSLQERRYLLDYHPAAGLLASPHFYTTDDELDAFLSQLDDILDRRDYERFEKR
jgi:kynureninase